MAEAYPWIVVALAAVVTYFWRAFGVMVSGRINPNGAVFQWVGCVAYALLAGLIGRMIMLPIGPVAATDLASRLTAAAVALAVFFLTRRNIFLGVTAGTGTLVGLTMAGGMHPL